MRCIYNCHVMAISMPPFNFAIIKSGYDIDFDVNKYINRIIGDPNIEGNYVTTDTKGYYRRFRKYL